MKKFIRGLALFPVRVLAVVLGVVLGLLGLAMLPLLSAQVKLAELAFRAQGGEEEDHDPEPQSQKST